MIKQALGAALLGMSLLGVQAAQADVFNLTYNIKLDDPDKGALIDTVATLQIEDFGGDVKFSLTAASDLAANFGAGAFVGSILYSGPVGVGTDGLTATLISGNDFVFGAAPNTLNLGADYRNNYNSTVKLFAGDTSVWTLSADYALSAADFGDPSAVHLQGLSGWNGYDNVGSMWVGTTAPIPEPETYAMLMTGLVAAGLFGRKRFTARRIF